MDEYARSVRAMKGYLRCTEKLITACTPGNVQHTSEGYGDAKSALIWTAREFEEGMRKRFSKGTNAVAFAKRWLDVYEDAKVFEKLQELFTVLSDQAQAVALTIGSQTSRLSAFRLVTFVSLPSFILLDHACTLVGQVHSCGSTSEHRQAVDQTLAALRARGFLAAVAGAARGIAAMAALVHSEAGQRELFGPTATTDPTASSTQELDQCLQQASFVAVTVNKYVVLLTEQAYTGVWTSLFGSSLVSPQLSPGAVDAWDALADSQLLAAAAVTLVDSPDVFTLPPDRTLPRNVVCNRVQDACRYAGISMYYMQATQGALHSAGGSEGQQLAVGLLRAMRHVAVRRLQVALLDQQAAHAGMGAALQGEDEGEEERDGQGQQAAQADGWTGSSGTWWFAREEARQRRLLGVGPGACNKGRVRDMQAPCMTGDELEDYYCHIVHGTLGTWGGVVASAEVPAGPPPLLVARLAARAAEALVRLCRGEGLGGAYGKAPEWQFAKAEGLVFHLLPGQQWDSLPDATARSCVPYWLEAAGWAVALLSDATAAAMGPLDATPRPDRPRRLLDDKMVADGSQANTLVGVTEALNTLAHSKTYGFKKLPAAAQADVRRRMFRCGLAASLDHTLRLAYSAQDGGAEQAGPKDLEKASMPALRVIEAGVVPLLPPVGSSGGSSQGAQAGDGGGSSQGAAQVEGGRGAAGTGTSEASGHQLGLLCTLSKRAAVLTRALEVVSGAEVADGGDRTKVQQLAKRAAEVLALLTAAVGSVSDSVHGRVATARQEAGAEASESGGGDDAACHQVGAAAGCGGEAHEALALAARAACNLAAPLGWHLAADMAAAAARGSEALAAGSRVVCDVLSCAVQWCRDSPLLPPQQLLACQPHRLLAAACALAVALPAAMGRHKQRLCAVVASAVAVLSSHGALSGRVRGWLASPPAAAATSKSGDPGGSSSSSGGNEVTVDVCAGCLAVPLLALVRHMAGTAPSYAAHTLALVQLAGGAHGSAAAGDGDGGFRRFAGAVAEAVADRCRDLRPGGFDEVLLPDHSQPSGLLHGEGEGEGAVDQLLPPRAVPLPPPLALPPSRALAFPRLRVCGNPRCGNFTGQSEGALPFKLCGGCRAVRYCGADRQRAHWREGHKVECKVLAAAGATAAGDTDKRVFTPDVLGVSSVGRY